MERLSFQRKVRMQGCLHIHQNSDRMASEHSRPRTAIADIEAGGAFARAKTGFEHHFFPYKPLYSSKYVLTCCRRSSGFDRPRPCTITPSTTRTKAAKHARWTVKVWSSGKAAASVRQNTDRPTAPECEQIGMCDTTYTRTFVGGQCRNQLRLAIAISGNQTRGWL